MNTGARASASAALVTVPVALWRPEVGLAAVVLLLVTTTVIAWVATPESSPLRRGWWVVALAGIPAALLGLPSLAPEATRPALGVVVALLLVLAVVLAAPARDPVEAREKLIEALLAGGLVAFVLAVAAGATGAATAVLLVVAAETSALWLVLRHPGAGNRGLGPARLLAGGLLLLLGLEVARLLGMVPADPRVGATVTASTLALWGLALAHREAGVPPPYRARGEQSVDPGGVSLVVLGVLAGPAAAAMHGLTDAAVEPPLAIGGAVLALLAVLHLLQLVTDRGRDAWRARHDALTGLPTAPLFEDRLRQAMATARRTGRGLALAFVDLDGFKQVNDRDGHEAGDAVLRAVASRLRGALREQDTVARKSGDEFLVLLPDVDDEMAAEIVAEKLLGAVREVIEVGEQQHRVGASVGLALWPRDGDTAEELVRHADAAMYESKDAGRGRVSWYSTTSTARARLRLILAQQFEEALGTAALELDHQPRVDLRDGTVVGLVSLVRWRHPDLGRLPPAAFLPIAAEAGLSELLDRHVLQRACIQAGRWARMGWLDVPIMVHISDAHTGAADLEQRVVQALTDGGLAPWRLQLGVTEDGLRLGGAVLEQTIADLAELGVATTLTRFGSGDAGLGRLAEVRLGGIEFGSEPVSRLQAGRAPFIEAAIELANQLGLSVSSNGVEGEAELHRLRSLGAPVARGRYLSPPLTKQELDVLLADMAGRDGHDPRGVLAADLSQGEDAATAEHPRLAAVVRDALHNDTPVEARALDDVLRRVSDLPEPFDEPEQGPRRFS